MKKIAFYLYSGLSLSPLLGNFYEHIPMLSPDMGAQELSGVTRRLKRIFFNTPSEERIRLAKRALEERLPGNFNSIMAQINKLSGALFEESISRDQLLSTIAPLLQTDRFGKRLMKYGNDEDQLVNVFFELGLEDRLRNIPLQANAPKVLFLKSFLDRGRDHVRNAYADKFARVGRALNSLQEHHDTLSDAEKMVARDIIDVYGNLFMSLEPLQRLEGNDLKEGLENLMSTQDYRNTKERYDALKEAFKEGKYITLSDVLEDILDDEGIED